MRQPTQTPRQANAVNGAQLVRHDETVPLLKPAGHAD